MPEQLDLVFVDLRLNNRTGRGYPAIPINGGRIWVVVIRGIDRQR
jgi:hypothetical protein